MGEARGSVATCKTGNQAAVSIGAVASGLFALSWLVPNHYRPWTSFYAEVPATAAAALWVACALRRADRMVRVSPLFLAFVAAATVPWLQWSVQQFTYMGDAVLASAYLAGAALCFWAGTVSDDATAERFAESFAFAASGAAALSTAIALYQWLGLSGLENWAIDATDGGRATGNVGQPNHLGTLVLCGVWGLVFLRSRDKLGPAASAALILWCLLGLALTQSRTAWVATAVVLGWTLRSRTALSRTLNLRSWWPLIFLTIYALFTQASSHGVRQASHSFGCLEEFSSSAPVSPSQRPS